MNLPPKAALKTHALQTLRASEGRQELASASGVRAPLAPLFMGRSFKVRFRGSMREVFRRMLSAIGGVGQGEGQAEGRVMDWDAAEGSLTSHRALSRRQNVAGAICPQIGELFEPHRGRCGYRRLAIVSGLPDRAAGRRQLLILDNASWQALGLNWHHFEPVNLPGEPESNPIDRLSTALRSQMVQSGKTVSIYSGREFWQPFQNRAHSSSIAR